MIQFIVMKGTKNEKPLTALDSESDYLGRSSYLLAVVAPPPPQPLALTSTTQQAFISEYEREVSR